MGAAVVLMPAQFTVTVGTASVECQLSEATYSTDVTEATIKTLCAENELATNESGKLKLAGYQDYTEPDGLCNFLWENALAEGEFVISGTDAAGATGRAHRHDAMSAPPVRPDGRRRSQVRRGVPDYRYSDTGRHARHDA